MLNISHEEAARYWYEFNDPMIYRVIMFMESVESWTLDGEPGLEAAMLSLANSLENSSAINIDTVGHEPAFIQLISQIKTGRGLRLLQAIDAMHPGSASKVLVYAEKNSGSNSESSAFFLQRNIVFERLRLLARTFSDKRLNLVESAIEGDE